MSKFIIVVMAISLGGLSALAQEQVTVEDVLSVHQEAIRRNTSLAEQIRETYPILDKKVRQNSGRLSAQQTQADALTQNARVQQGSIDSNAQRLSRVEAAVRCLQKDGRLSPEFIEKFRSFLDGELEVERHYQRTNPAFEDTVNSLLQEASSIPLRK